MRAPSLTAMLLPDGGPFLITAADIRAALGLVTTEHDQLIELAIAYSCIEIESRFRQSLSRKVWMVKRDPSIPEIIWLEAVRQQIGGGHEIGPDYTDERYPGVWRNVTTNPKQATIERTIPFIARRCVRNYPEIADALHDERARARVEASSERVAA